VADALYLNLWFPSFTPAEMMPRMLAVLRQFPFSAQRPGVTAFSIYPLSWSEAPVLAQSFAEQADPDVAVSLAAEFLHDDYGYEFQAAWDLWVPNEVDRQRSWTLLPQRVSFIANSLGFDEGVYEHDGHIQIDFGLDEPFLQETEAMTPETALRVHANVQKLVDFTNALEKNCGISGRVLWSESEENLAQKLIARLQKVQ
jgi:hypothetical protein